MTDKASGGNYFEHFQVGQEFVHPTPRTLSGGDVAVYTALFSPRFALQSSDEFARGLGLKSAPLDSLLVFHTVFGKTVTDISWNATANLGYAQGRFGALVYPGDTLRTTSRVIGLRQTRDGRAGIVYVRSVGLNQRDEMVVDYCRWVLVPKRDLDAPAPKADTPSLADSVAESELIVPLDPPRGYDPRLSGSAHFFEDYEVGERIDHQDGLTIEESEHMMATRLFQNTARVHFNQHQEAEGRFGRRIVYGGYVMSLARSLSFNGLGNGLLVAAINGGRHVNPSFGGDTIYAWSEVLGKMPLKGPVGGLRIRTVATKNRPCADYPRLKGASEGYEDAVVLDFDYSVLIPKRSVLDA